MKHCSATPNGVFRTQPSGLLYLVEIFHSDQVNIGTKRFLNPFAFGLMHPGYYVSYHEIPITKDEAVIFRVSFDNRKIRLESLMIVEDDVTMPRMDGCDLKSKFIAAFKLTCDDYYHH